MSEAGNLSFFERAAELAARGESFATVTVVRAEKPTSGKPGDKAIVTAAGDLIGFVGGSCAEPAMIDEALDALDTGEPRFVRLSPDPGKTPVREGIRELPMTCYSGGTMDFYIEPQVPPPTLVVVGDAPVAVNLERLGEAMGYRVRRHRPEDVASVEALGLGPRTYLVVACHGDEDGAVLREVLRWVDGGGKVAYIGLVASRKRGGQVLEGLRRDLDEALVKRVRSPAGLDIGARRPQEVALSILGEMIGAA